MPFSEWSIFFFWSATLHLRNWQKTLLLCLDLISCLNYALSMASYIASFFQWKKSSSFSRLKDKSSTFHCASLWIFLMIPMADTIDWVSIWQVKKKVRGQNYTPMVRPSLSTWNEHHAVMGPRNLWQPRMFCGKFMRCTRGTGFGGVWMEEGHGCERMPRPMWCKESSIRESFVPFSTFQWL